MTKFWEFLDLLSTVDPAPIVPERLLVELDFEDNTLSCSIGCPLLSPRFFIKGGDLGKVWNPIYNQKRNYIKVVSEQPPNEDQFELTGVVQDWTTKNDYIKMDFPKSKDV
ncbi:hypothetical protein M9H77_29666 [Catharanthus roseus]|uniref:Uncharacterized protein n=1 Tax=Catharanthus roseus TaxID=4058 RepID=A0ACB9ZVG5_CATRO|nr:hypothetical protein M9H77_29666 [Catharanthus roseus]